VSQTSQAYVKYANASCRELRWELNIDRNNTESLTYPDFFPSPPEQSTLPEESTWYFYLADIALRRLTIRLFNYLHHRTRHQATPSELIAMAQDFERQADDWHACLSFLDDLD
jgi:hypothetical protein